MGRKNWSTGTQKNPKNLREQQRELQTERATVQPLEIIGGALLYHKGAVIRKIAKEAKSSHPHWGEGGGSYAGETFEGQDVKPTKKKV